jgi:hypothetical protein
MHLRHLGIKWETGNINGCIQLGWRRWLLLLRGTRRFRNLGLERISLALAVRSIDVPECEVEVPGLVWRKLGAILFEEAYL